MRVLPLTTWVVRTDSYCVLCHWIPWDGEIDAAGVYLNEITSELKQFYLNAKIPNSGVHTESWNSLHRLWKTCLFQLPFRSVSPSLDFLQMRTAPPWWAPHILEIVPLLSQFSGDCTVTAPTSTVEARRPAALRPTSHLSTTEQLFFFLESQYIVQAIHQLASSPSRLGVSNLKSLSAKPAGFSTAGQRVKQSWQQLQRRCWKAPVPHDSCFKQNFLRFACWSRGVAHESRPWRQTREECFSRGDVFFFFFFWSSSIDGQVRRRVWHVKAQKQQPSFQLAQLPAPNNERRTHVTSWK